MSTVNIRELSRNTSGVVDEVSRTGRPALVTKHGEPVAAVIPIDAGDIEDLVLSKSREYLDDLTAAGEDLAAGHTRPAGEVFAELDD